MAAFGMTDAGRQRSSNEDAFCVEPSLGLLAVADGLGGRAAGETASKLAIFTLTNYLRSHLEPAAQGSFLDLLAKAVQASNAAIQEVGAKEPQCQGMATTLTACLVADGMAYFAHIGDSRAYLLRHGHIARLTEDHTVATLRRLGGRNHVEIIDPAKGNRLLSALGVLPWVGVDLFAQKLRAGDLLLLCTDGLTGGVTEEELAALGQLKLSLAARCARLLALANERGGADNVTVVLAALHASAYGCRKSHMSTAAPGRPEDGTS